MKKIIPFEKAEGGETLEKLSKEGYLFGSAKHQLPSLSLWDAIDIPNF